MCSTGCFSVVSGIIGNIAKLPNVKTMQPREKFFGNEGKNCCEDVKPGTKFSNRTAKTVFCHGLFFLLLVKMKANDKKDGKGQTTKLNVTYGTEAATTRAEVGGIGLASLSTDFSQVGLVEAIVKVAQ